MPIRTKGPTTDRHPRREWNSPERREERQKEYMAKHGNPEPRRKRLTPADTTRRDRDKKIENLHERMGGGEKAKPHSSREGRVASGKNRLDRYRKKAQDIMKPITVKRKRKHSGVRILKAKGGKAGTGPSPGTRIKARKAREAEWWTGRQGMHAVYNPTIDKKLREKRPHSSPEGRMRDVKAAYAKYAAEPKRTWGKPGTRKYGGGAKTPQRAKKAIGGKIVQKIISKIKPKPKEVDVDKLLKNLGDEIKAQPIPPKIQKKIKELQKAYPHHDSAGKLKKAKGGRIKGPNRPRPQGPHMWVRGAKRKRYASGGLALRGQGAIIK